MSSRVPPIEGLAHDDRQTQREHRRRDPADVPRQEDRLEEDGDLHGYGGGGERDRPVSERPGKFAYPPQLLLVDGGKGQLNVAEQVVRDLGLDEEIPVASLAKRFEEVYVPGQADPVEVPRQSEALFLLQRIRDEAHRFANTYHRELRGKRMTRSVLDDIPGLGPTRKKRLVKEMGGMNAVRKASLDELRELTWLPDAVAEAVYHKVHGNGRG